MKLAGESLHSKLDPVMEFTNCRFHRSCPYSHCRRRPLVLKKHFFELAISKWKESHPYYQEMNQSMLIMHSSDSEK